MSTVKALVWYTTSWMFVIMMFAVVSAEKSTVLAKIEVEDIQPELAAAEAVSLALGE